MSDWQSLQAAYQRDRDYSARTTRLLALMQVRENSLYDRLPHPFSAEFSGSGEYIKLSDRRPSVKTALCRVVVDDSVSLLFSEGHWPVIASPNDDTAQAMVALVKQTALNAVMLTAATMGSVGSVAILLRVLRNRPFYEPMDTAHLVPTWQPDAPDVLLKVKRSYKVKGADLADAGWTIAEMDRGQMFWLDTVWDADVEQWFQPRRVGSDNPPVEDDERSVTHGLGFVPIVWIRNLPGASGPDGDCTFERAIDVMIEGDYLLSQAGRALKYGSDPKVVLSVDGEVPPQQGGASRSLVLPPNSDAKLLEIGGEAARTVLEHTRELRAIALEAIHGNRAHADKLSAATSGRSIELMMGSLIWLVDRLRLTYGEGGLLSLLRMTMAASQVIEGGLEIGGKAVKLDAADLELRWPPWMPPMPQDLLVTAQAVVTAYAGGVISLEAAVARMASLLGIDDVTAEMKLIQDAAALKQQQAEAAAAAQLATTQGVRQQANVGPAQTRKETA